MCFINRRRSIDSIDMLKCFQQDWSEQTVIAVALHSLVLHDNTDLISTSRKHSNLSFSFFYNIFEIPFQLLKHSCRSIGTLYLAWPLQAWKCSELRQFLFHEEIYTFLLDIQDVMHTALESSSVNWITIIFIGLVFIADLRLPKLELPALAPMLHCHSCLLEHASE